jgi:uncharacterized protein YdeI (YjbR/CyaY-like superfamily)
MKSLYFATPEDWRRWLAGHHATTDELWVGLHKKGSGRPSITWPEAVDGALCYGWIDGVRRSVDESRYTIRFTPRRPGSAWSAVNLKRVAQLTRKGLMAPAGIEVFQNRRKDRSGLYSFEQRRTVKLTGEYLRRLRAAAAAWRFFKDQAPWYQRTASFWVISAKREETRLKRLATLIDDSAAGRVLGPLKRPKRGGPA